MNQVNLFKLIEAERKKLRPRMFVKDLRAKACVSKNSYQKWKRGAVSANLCDVLIILEILKIKIEAKSE